MHVFQTTCNINQLDDELVRVPLVSSATRTSSMRFVCRSLSTNSLILPFSIHAETIANRCLLTVTPMSGKIFGCRRCFHATPSRQNLCDVFMHEYDNAYGRLTLRMTSKSLVMYTRTTLIATRRPSYTPCDTSAHPPFVTSVEPCEQSGMCMDLGITRCRLHVLQNLLNNFNRSRSDIASFSRRCNLHQHRGKAGRAEKPA